MINAGPARAFAPIAPSRKGTSTDAEVHRYRFSSMESTTFRERFGTILAASVGEA
jgi:hypothetical protein